MATEQQPLLTMVETSASNFPLKTQTLLYSAYNLQEGCILQCDELSAMTGSRFFGFRAWLNGEHHHGFLGNMRLIPTQEEMMNSGVWQDHLASFFGRHTTVSGCFMCVCNWNC
jgi:hypothetical protein